ncbi:MAG TPA: hypothetical protein VI636_15975 [Candidatus Angelobacter sp.]
MKSAKAGFLRKPEKGENMSNSYEVKIKYKGSQIFLDPSTCGSAADPLQINDQVTWKNKTDEDCTVTPQGELQLSPSTVLVPKRGSASATIVGALPGINNNNYTCASASLASAANDSTPGVIIVDGPEVVRPKETPKKVPRKLQEESELVGANGSRR